MKELIKKLFKCVFGDYSIYHIYSRSKNGKSRPLTNPSEFHFSPLAKSDVEGNNEEVIRDQTWYHGANTYAYGCIEGSRIVAVCYFWYGERYRERNYWPLLDDEAKLVQIVTLPEMRGRGVATRLISYAASDMFENGFNRIYARIWHSNAPSLKAFESAGWHRVASIAELYPMRRKRPLRMVLRTASTSVEEPVRC
jgi:RimJ/RimL family protein N-acetyltransferase